MTGQIGTPGWTAPEVFKSSSYGPEVDVYSYAILLAECSSGEKPFAGMDAMQIAFATVYRNKRPELAPTLPPAVAKLVRTCWDSDPTKRPSFATIVDQLRRMRREATAPGNARRGSANPKERAAGPRAALASAEQQRRGTAADVSARAAALPPRRRDAPARPLRQSTRELRAEQPNADRRAVSEVRRRVPVPLAGSAANRASQPSPVTVKSTRSARELVSGQLATANGFAPVAAARSMGARNSAAADASAAHAAQPTIARPIPLPASARQASTLPAPAL